LQPTCDAKRTKSEVYPSWLSLSAFRTFAPEPWLPDNAPANP
jgi:hypothetical protein